MNILFSVPEILLLIPTHINTAGVRKTLSALHRNVRNIRMSEKIGVKYMQKWEELVYAREKGRRTGEERGEMLLLIRQICKKLTKGQPPEIIADELEADPETVRQICQAVRKTGPDIDCNQLYEQIFGEPSVMEF